MILFFNPKLNQRLELVYQLLDSLNVIQISEFNTYKC